MPSSFLRPSTCRREPSMLGHQQHPVADRGITCVWGAPVPCSCLQPVPPGLPETAWGSRGYCGGDRGTVEGAPEPLVGLRRGSPGGRISAAGLREDPARDLSMPARAFCNSGVGAGLSASSWTGVGMLHAGVQACRPKLASVRAPSSVLRQRTGCHGSGSIMGAAAAALTHHMPEVWGHRFSGMTEVHAWLGAVSACHAQRARMGECNDCEA